MQKCGALQKFCVNLKNDHQKRVKYNIDHFIVNVEDEPAVAVEAAIVTAADVAAAEVDHANAIAAATAEFMNCITFFYCQNKFNR